MTYLKSILKSINIEDKNKLNRIKWEKIKIAVQVKCSSK